MDEKCLTATMRFAQQQKKAAPACPSYLNHLHAWRMHQRATKLAGNSALHSRPHSNTHIPSVKTTPRPDIRTQPTE